MPLEENLALSPPCYPRCLNQTHQKVSYASWSQVSLPSPCHHLMIDHPSCLEIADFVAILLLALRPSWLGLPCVLPLVLIPYHYLYSFEAKEVIFWLVSSLSHCSLVQTGERTINYGLSYFPSSVQGCHHSQLSHPHRTHSRPHQSRVQTQNRWPMQGPSAAVTLLPNAAHLVMWSTKYQRWS